MPKYSERLLGVPLISNSIQSEPRKLDFQPEFRFPWTLWLILSAIMAIIGLAVGAYAGHEHAQTLQACIQSTHDFRACSTWLR